MRIGIRLPACRPVNELAQAARYAERLGFDDVRVPVSQLLWRDVFTAWQRRNRPPSCARR